MSKIKEFFTGLNKSTRITLLSCGCFVVMTAVILAFFIMFPITPSEKIISSIGRENVVREDGSGNVVTAVPGGVTTVSTAAVTTTAKATSTRAAVTTAHTSFTIQLTTGSGFLWNGRIPTGIMPGGGSTSTTVVEDPGNATDPGVPYDPGTQEPTVPWVDPGTGEDPGTWVDPGTGTITDPGTGEDPGTLVDPGTGEDPGTGTITDPGTGEDPGIVTPPPPDTPSIEPDYGSTE